jgi:urease accessory protein
VITVEATPAPGTAHVTFTRVGSDTVVTRAFAWSPSKLIATKARASTCWVYAATFGGGLVGGDAIHLNVDVRDDARALLTTQASTKVYRSLRPSRQTIVATVAARALLAVVPDPLVCFAGADFTQHQRYDLHADANLVVVDWMSSGRHAAGERWAFSKYESRLDIRRNAQAVIFDTVVLERNLDCVAERMGRFDAILIAVITGPLFSSAIDDLVERTAREPITPRADLVVSTAALRDGGVLLRMAGTNVERLGRALREHLACLTPFVGDDLWSRKW